MQPVFPPALLHFEHVLLGRKGDRRNDKQFLLWRGHGELENSPAGLANSVYKSPKQPEESGWPRIIIMSGRVSKKVRLCQTRGSFKTQVDIFFASRHRGFKLIAQKISYYLYIMTSALFP